MVLAILTAMALMGGPEHERLSVRGGLYEGGGCERLEGWVKLRPFEEFSGDSVRETMEFSCAVALYLDQSELTLEQKFGHLMEQALRGEEWAAALSEPLARLDFAGYQDFLLKHAKTLQPAAWRKACRIFDSRSWWSHLREPDHWRYSSAILRLFYEQALHSQNADVRSCMIFWFNNAAITEAQAHAFADHLSVEEVPSIRAGILDLQLWLNSSRANKMIRDFLRGPIEYDVIHGICTSYALDESRFVMAKRYDLLPDLKALRARLPGVIAAENDVRRKNQVKKDAERVMGDLDILIAALEKKQAEDERDAKTKGDAGSPAKEARGSTK